MQPDDGRMAETCCGNNIGKGEEELLRCQTHNCFVNYTHTTRSITTQPQYVITTVTTISAYHGNHNL
jgi:hypothetical protein